MVFIGFSLNAKGEAEFVFFFRTMAVVIRMKIIILSGEESNRYLTNGLFFSEKPLVEEIISPELFGFIEGG